MNRLTLVHIENQLAPLNNTRTVVDFDGNKSVFEILFPLGRATGHGVTLNGQIVEEADYHQTYPANGDYLTTATIPAGGGGDGGKNIIRIVALIAIAVYAPYLSGLADFTLMGQGIMLTNAGFAAMQAGIVVGGSMLVNAMLPPPKPTKATSESPTYGIDGAQNTSAEGIVVPVTYGTFRFGGNILNNYVVNDENSQVLYMLINAGEGPIAGISAVEINDQPIVNWQTNSVDTKFHPEVILDRLGTSTQQPIPWFHGAIVPHEVNQEFTENWKTVSVGSAVSDVYDQVRVDIVAPGGLFGTDDRGRPYTGTVELQVEYRPLGSTGEWTPLQLTDRITGYTEALVWSDAVPLGMRNVVGNGYTYDATIHAWGIFTDGETTSWQTVATYQQVPIYAPSGSIAMTANQRTPLRRSISSASLPQNAYEFRYRRMNASASSVGATDRVDNIFLTTINKVIEETVAYRNCALIGLKIRLSDQLTGIPKVTHLNHGKIIKVWDEGVSAWALRPSSNPAWITWDILTNKRYGGGSAEGRLDFNRWREWAYWCDQNNLTFNGTLDTASNVWDAASLVSRTGRAQIVPVGTRYSIIIERAELPVQMFSVANIIAGTMKESWTSMADRANEVEITFNDINDGYRSRTVRVYDKVQMGTGAPQRSASIDMPGIVTAQRAHEEASLLLNLNRYIQRSIEFAASMDAIACSVGSVISVQHDMPQWGFGGRTESGCTASLLKLDRPVSMEYGKTYQTMIHSDSVVRHTGTIHSIVGTTVFINGYTGANDVRRLVYAAGNKDLEVGSIVSNDLALIGPPPPGFTVIYGVDVESVAGLSVGNTVSLYDTNVLTSRAVVNPLTVGQQQEFTEITLSSPLASAPSQFAKWLFGETTKVVKPFRVTRISGSGDYRRDITAIEYNASVYDPTGAVPTMNYSANNPRLLQPVVIDGVAETIIWRDSFMESQIAISYSSSQQTYADADVYVAINGDTYTQIGQHKSVVTMIADRGDVLKFKVIARDKFGNVGGFVDAAFATYTVLGNTKRPSLVDGMSFSALADGYTISWLKPPEEDLAYTEVRLGGATWLDGSVIYSGKDTQTPHFPYLEVGTYQYRAKHFNHGGFESNDPASLLEQVVLAPNAAVFAAVEKRSGSCTVRWSDCATTQPIKQYAIRVGEVTDLYSALTDYAIVSGATFVQTLTFDVVGTKRIWVTAEDAGGNLGTPASVDVEITASEVANVKLVSSSQIFQINKLGVNSPAAVTLTATPSGAVASATPTWSTSPSVTLTGLATDNVRTLPYANMGPNDAVTVTVSYTDGTDTYTDAATIVKLREGVDGEAGDAITMVLSNEAHLIPCNTAGTPVADAFLGAETLVKVYLGIVDDTDAWTFARTNSAVTSATGGTSLAPVVSVSAISANQGYVDIVGTRTGGGYPTVTKRFSLAKAVQGATGAATTIYRIAASAPVIVKAAPNAGTSGVHTNVTVSGEQVTGTTISSYGFLTLTANGVAEAATATAGSITSAIADGAGKTSYTAKLYNQATVAGATLLDTEVINVVFKGDTGTTGTDALTVELSNDSHPIPTDSSGNNGVYAGSGTNIYVYEGATQLAYDGSGLTNGTWKVTAVGSSISPSVSFTDAGIFVTVGDHSAMTAATATVNYTIVGKRANGTGFSIVKSQTFSKNPAGGTGLNGTRTAVLDLYRWSASVPITFPSGTSTYTWANGQFTSPATLNGWAATPPAPVLGQTLYVVREVFTDTGTSLTSVVTWSASTSAPFSASGVNGQRVGVLEVYKWSASAPITYPSGTSTYTWATGAFTAPDTANGWALVPGAAVAGQTLWGISVNVSDNLTTPTSLATWSSTTVYPIGVAGTDGTAAKVVALSATSQVIQVSKSGVASPASVTFTANGQNLSGSPAFTIIDGAVGGGLTGSGTTRSFTYANMSTDFVTVRVIWDSLTDEITVVKLREGVDTIIGFLTNESHTIPTAADGTGGVYTSATGTFKVFAGTTDVTASASFSVSSSVNCNTPVISGLGVYSLNYTIGDVATMTLQAVYGGVTIQKIFTISRSKAGNTGPTGQSARRAYIVNTSVTSPLSPTPGTGDVVPVGGWSFTATTTLTSGQYQHQVDGIYTAGGNIAWGNPYLASFKVGQLDAFTVYTGTLQVDESITVADTGHIKGGQTAWNTGAGFFLGYTALSYRFSIGDGGANSLTWNGTGLSIRGSLISMGDFAGGYAWPAAGGGTAISNSGGIRIGNSAQGFEVTATGNIYVGPSGGPYNFSVVGGSATFSGALSAATGTFGALTVATGGNIKSGQTAYNSGTGFWLGLDGVTPKFSIGVAAGNRLTWDGATLTIVGGTITSPTITSPVINGGLTATIGSVSDTGNVNGTTATGSATVSSVSGGRTPYTYQWFTSSIETYGGPTGISFNGLTGTSYSVSAVGTNGFLDQNVTCVITDANGLTLTKTAFISLQWGAQP